MLQPAQAIADAATQLAQHLPEYRLYYDYYNGNHHYDYLTARQARNLAPMISQARSNLMPAAVQAFTDKLEIASWGDGDTIGQATRQGLAMIANLVHTEAFRTGDAYTITWNNPRTATPDVVFHRADMVVPQIDDTSPAQLAWATKFWTTPDGWGRANLYTPEALHRYITCAKQSTTSQLMPASPTSWQAYETSSQPHNFQTVPVVWWRRAATSQFDYGVSVLKNLIPVQDRLNKAISDLLVASERVALPLRYVMDVAPELLQPKLSPETGRLEPPKIPFDETVNSILALTAKGPAGQFPGPDAEKILAIKTDAENELARVGGIPPFYFATTSGNVPSGESLRVLRERLTSTVHTFQQDATPAWKGQLELLGADGTQFRWASFDEPDPGEKLDNARTERDLGLPPEIWLRTAGYSPDMLIDGTTLAQAVTAHATTSADTLGSLFRAGVSPADYQQ